MMSAPYFFLLHLMNICEYTNYEDQHYAVFSSVLLSSAALEPSIFLSAPFSDTPQLRFRLLRQKTKFHTRKKYIKL
jgi:hypothetical protein